MKWLERRQYWLFGLLVVFLPTQLGWHFWPRWSFVNGVRVDYFSPTLFLTDVLIWGIFVLEVVGFFQRKRRLRLGFFGILGVLGIVAAGNIMSSLSLAVSLYKWVKVLEFGFVAFWLSRNRPSLPVYKFTSLLLLPVFYESVLAIWQFFSHSSIGGIWYFLGERTFNAATPGIANAFINGQLVLRPYGTFPHPNVLGGFLAVILPLILALRLPLDFARGCLGWASRFYSPEAHFLHNSRKLTALGRLGVFGVLGLGVTALLLSLSRTAILVGLVGSLVVCLGQQSRRKWGRLGVLGGLGLLGAMILVWPRFGAIWVEKEPVTAREQLNTLAIEEWRHSPIWGTGLGTSSLYGLQSTDYRLQLKNYALAYQPTHNIYLLLLAETGLVGLGVFGVLGVWGLRNLIRQKNFVLLTSLFSILALGLFDHYFLTLQQGQLILALILGLSF